MNSKLKYMNSKSINFTTNQLLTVAPSGSYKLSGTDEYTHTKKNCMTITSPGCPTHKPTHTQQHTYTPSLEIHKKLTPGRGTGAEDRLVIDWGSSIPTECWPYE